MQFALEVTIVECSFVKHSQGIVGVKLNCNRDHIRERELNFSAAAFSLRLPSSV
jgi:hypothetical protein